MSKSYFYCQFTYRLFNDQRQINFCGCYMLYFMCNYILLNISLMLVLRKYYRKS